MKQVLIILAGLLAGSASAQYSVNWYKIAGGGGTVSNSLYTINATVGQCDADGPLTGGGYSLTGGFWAMQPVQTPVSPRLRSFLTATNTVVVAWPAPSTGFHLQQNTALGTANWSNVTNLVSVVNGENQVTISPPAGSRFYRLIYP